MKAPRTQKKTSAHHAEALCGAEKVNRTPDLLITNQLLYRLSYLGDTAN